MNIHYNDKTDLLYIRFEEGDQPIINKRISEDVVLDIGKGEKIVGIEIMDASQHINLKTLLPITYKNQDAASAQAS